MMKNLPVCSLILVVLASGIHGHPSGKGRAQICTPGTQTKVDCNTCTCSQDGTALACTKMECVQIPTEYFNADGSVRRPHQDNPLLRTKRDSPNPLKCKPNESFMDEDGCNRCTCSSDGRQAICTLMECLPEDFMLRY